MELVVAKGTIVADVRDMGSHGRVASIRDPQGNLIQFFEPSRPDVVTPSGNEAKADSQPAPATEKSAADTRGTSTKIAPVDPDIFKRAMRNAAGTVGIVSTGIAGERHGLTVSAACSLSAEPPTVLICVNKSAGGHDTISATGSFGWNVLASDQMHLAQRFSGAGGLKGDARFDDEAWHTLLTGAPLLVDSLCSFDCKVVDAYPSGTHTIYIGSVVGHTERDNAAALAYWRGQFAELSPIN